MLSDEEHYILAAREEARRVDDLTDAVQEHAGVIVREMEAYYRDGRHPDLRPVLRAGRALLRLTEEA